MYVLSKQYQLFANLVRYLKSSNNYYQSLLDKYNIIDENNIQEIYANLPVITKQTIINNSINYYDNTLLTDLKENNIDIDEIFETNNLSDNHDKKLNTAHNSWYIETTSGTTGKPLPVVKSPLERLVESKHLINCRRRIDPQCTLSNGFLMVHKTDNYLKGIDLRGNNKNTLKKAYKYLLKTNPKWIFSTTLLFNQFVKCILECNRKPQQMDLSFVETTSQLLYTDDKIRASKIFNCLYINNYGCREVWNIAYSCKYGNLHVNTDNLIVDLVDDNGKIINQENVEGNIVISSLFNKTTPFIKYVIGDRGKILYTECTCGQPMPVLVLSEGRKAEKLVGTNYYGNVIFRKVLRTLFFHKNIKDIHYLKIIQTKLDEIVIYVEKDKEYDMYFERCFIDNFRLQIGDCKKFSCHFVYRFPFSKNQTKDAIFISKVWSL